MKRKMTLILIVMVAVLAGCATKQEAPLTDFDKVEILNGFTVNINVGEEYSVVLEVAEDVLEHVEAVNTGDTLIIRAKPGHDARGAALKAEVTMPTLRRLTLDNGSHVTVNGSGGDVTIIAKAGSVANLDDFAVENADVTELDGSQVTVNVTGRLVAKITGSSKIYYLGDPSIDPNQEYRGSIRPK